MEWGIENPTDPTYTLTSGDTVTINIELPQSLIGQTSQFVVEWTQIESEKYRLKVIADGIELHEIKSNIKLSKEIEYSYLLRQEGETYKAMPYNYKDGKFNFKVSRTGKFYFSTEKRTFNDIAKFTEMQDDIEELASRHIVYGVSPDKYAPSGKVTRAEFAVMVSRALALVPSDKDTPFTDTKGEWYEKDVQALYEAGIISGVTETRFNPNGKLTRQEAATMLYNVLQENGEGNYLPGTDIVFKDADKIADFAKTAVEVLEMMDIVHGTPSGEFEPTGKLTRAQMAKMLTGVLKVTGDM